MKLAGIDYGMKRVGLASTDRSGKFALPRKVLKRDNELLENVLALFKEWEIEKVIVGESKDFKGNPNPIDYEAKEFGKKIEEAGYQVVFHPEVLTSMEAERLQGKNQMLDASAAAIILKSYIDSYDFNR